MPVVSTAKMTARQFLRLGEDPPAVRLELVEGNVAVSPSLRPRHSHVEKRLSHVLLAHLIRNDQGTLLGDTDTVIGEFDVRRPDLIFFKRERTHLISADAPIKAMPDLCVEIVSPTSGTIDRHDKFNQYATAGVPFYWIVDPELRTVEAYRLEGDRYQLAARGGGDEQVTLPPFPDLKIPLAQIWFPEPRG